MIRRSWFVCSIKMFVRVELYRVFNGFLLLVLQHIIQVAIHVHFHSSDARADFHSLYSANR